MNFVKSELRDFRKYLYIMAGVFLVALSLNMFLIPAKLAPGGASGIATILYYVAKVPVGVTILVLNIPLWYFEYRDHGLSVIVRTVFATVLMSSFTEIFRFFQPITNELLLSSIYGGVLMGAGLGIVFSSGASTGGTDILAKLISRKVGFLSTGQALFLIDAVIVLSSGVIFRDIDIMLYSAVALFISSKLVDVLAEGVNYARGAYIISEHADEISRLIMDEVERGTTVFYGKGGYSGKEKKILYCVFRRSELVRIKEIVKSADPNAFLILNEVKEVLGEGF